MPADIEDKPIHLEALDPKIKVLRQAIVNAWVLWCGIVTVVFLFNPEFGLLVAPLAMAWLILTTILRLYHMSQVENYQHYRQTEALMNLHALIQIRQPLPPMRLWSASPDLAVLIVAHIRQHKPKTIVELGTGVSTIVGAYALESIGEGKIYSVEHQSEFAAVNQARLEQHSLASYVEMIHAPLVDNWYVLSAFNPIEKIDLLVVDGPPGLEEDDARYPAVPKLIDMLADDGFIVVDDYLRDYAVVQRWLQEFPLEIYSEHINEKGTVFLRKK